MDGLVAFFSARRIRCRDCGNGDFGGRGNGGDAEEIDGDGSISCTLGFLVEVCAVEIRQIE